MITSLGTCRLVIPRSESTMASAGPASYTRATAASIASRSSSGSASSAESTLARPLFGFAPTRASASPWSANTSAK